MFGGFLDIVAQVKDNLVLGRYISVVSSFARFLILDRWRGCYVIPVLPHQKVDAIKCVEDEEHVGDGVDGEAYGARYEHAKVC